ncbi:L-ascorbate metabolism protein UlaG (beta-lactamase superfamily) [Roseivirga pacifica]|uniref:L-ascorbate metabolism protein UlaG, beta-lactamase superfamily n=1 Tax=Roseivirga pacifica TaxID=1267423 RepID=A0A1I0QJR2_9BACT|nr:MBL fold metallo-hydrolase [Roseivirga pacifica]RKQ42851.1 L-ascorbate metabolism protein UlaG (beta-lactamase superfamily) [Roseivirga pacifica]SEW27437.1 L-ascorbate metabolism protein UlaG, beta-lactamase superfamily [Roseivirga pacifica]
MIKQFGGKLTKALKARYSQSPNWKENKFLNLEETTMSISLKTLPKILYKQFFEKNGREPAQPLPVVPFDKAAFLAPSEKAKLIWYGHSVMLMRISGKTILIDPMLGPDAAPIAPFATKRFSENTLNLIEKFPEIDLVLLTHDHYDHLDLASIKLLKPKVKQYFVSLGTARHLEKWGIDSNQIQEFDWWDDAQCGDIKITFTPSRHFSGRGLTDRAQSLWGGWVFKTPTESIYFSGDGGYGEHFKAVGEKLGPFDFGIMECGQYNENWHQIHMYPEEAIQAANEAKVAKAMAVHWAGFALAQHHWKEPIERFTTAALAAKLPLLLPKIGAQFSVNDELLTEWWKTLE